MFLFIITGTIVQGQIPKEDIHYLETTDPADHNIINGNPEYVFSNTDKLFLKYNPFSLVYGGIIYGYQHLLSHQFSANCYYEPSCSEFSKQLVREFGLFKGIFLTVDRLMRCNRIAATSFHPVRIDQESGKIHESTEIFKY